MNTWSSALTKAVLANEFLTWKWPLHCQRIDILSHRVGKIARKKDMMLRMVEGVRRELEKTQWALRKPFLRVRIKSCEMGRRIPGREVFYSCLYLWCTNPKGFDSTLDIILSLDGHALILHSSSSRNVLLTFELQLIILIGQSCWSLGLQFHWRIENPTFWVHQWDDGHPFESQSLPCRVHGRIKALVG